MSACIIQVLCWPSVQRHLLKEEHMICRAFFIMILVVIILFPVLQLPPKAMAQASISKGNTDAPSSKTNSIDDLIKKGVGLAKLGKYNDAISLFDQTLVIEPNNINALIDKGLTLRVIGKNNEAMTSYDKALSINPNDIQALKGKALVLVDLQKYNEAMVLFDKVLSMNPNDTIYN
jgi:tetratricopeptide (TPR) repeat protein